MNKAKTLAGMLSASVVTAALVATPALAWHPKGVIVKYVQNETTQSAMSDANDVAHAPAAKPGDILSYTILVRNDAVADTRGYNDMAQTTLTDTLPAGVELVGSPSTRTITANLGTIVPGQKVSKEYRVKVTATKDGVIENKACFTGNSKANDNPQSGCDVADVTVKVPVTPDQPQTPVQPKQPAPQVTPQALPNTGAVDILGGAAGIGSLGYASLRYFRSKRNLKNSHTG